jgi:hypothetical protein
VYFLRPEILKAAKVTEAEVQSAPPEYKRHVEALRGKSDVAGYAQQTSLQPVGGLKIGVVTPAGPGLAVRDTTMCPW